MVRFQPKPRWQCDNGSCREAEAATALYRPAEGPEADGWKVEVIQPGRSGVTDTAGDRQSSSSQSRSFRAALLLKKSIIVIKKYSEKIY